MLFVGKALENVGGNEARCEPTNRVDGDAKVLSGGLEDGVHLLFAGRHHAVGSHKICHDLRDINASGALDVFMVRVGIGQGGDVVAHPVALQQLDKRWV